MFVKRRDGAEKVPFVLTEKTDIKIFILYLLMHIERPVDFATLHDIVVQDEFVRQFDFMDCFYELCETEAIQKFEKDGTEYYTITPKGRSATEALQSDLLRPIRERALRSALRLLSFQSRGTKAKSSVSMLENGKYKLDCECRDSEGVFMQTSVVVDTKRQAELMKYHFDDKAELIYRGILSLLSGDMNYLADSWASDNDE